LAFLFAVLAYRYHHLAPNTTRTAKRWWKAVDRSFAAFFECAIYFSLAIQLASVVFLAKRDFGVAPEGFGANETQISLMVSVVCMLPLLCPVALLSTDRKNDGARKDPRRNLHFFLFSLTTLLFFYPFLSQMIHTWAPTRVGKGNDEGRDTIDDDEWENLNTACLGDVRQLSNSERWALAVIVMVSSVVIYLFTIWIMFGRLLNWGDSHTNGEKGRLCWRSMTGRVQGALQSGVVQGVVLTVPTALAVALLYFLFELRSIQEELTVSLGGEYTGNDWGFGQIISVTIFAPVLVEFIYSLMYL
jgi:hypothetical protein